MSDKGTDGHSLVKVNVHRVYGQEHKVNVHRAYGQEHKINVCN